MAADARLSERADVYVHTGKKSTSRAGVAPSQLSQMAPATAIRYILVEHLSSCYSRVYFSVETVMKGRENTTERTDSQSSGKRGRTVRRAGKLFGDYPLCLLYHMPRNPLLGSTLVAVGLSASLFQNLDETERNESK